MAEVSVYVASSTQGKGIGAGLLEGLIAASEAEAYWTLQAQIMVENHASCALHSKCGFREIGIRERLGHLGGVWHDVVLLERRSERTSGPSLPTHSCD